MSAPVWFANALGIITIVILLCFAVLLVMAVWDVFIYFRERRP